MQDLQNYAADMSDVRRHYDVTLFYNMHGTAPDQRSGTVIERLGETDQGIFVLHHGILGLREWHIWSAVTGIEDRKFTYHPGETIRTEIADPGHPISAGLQPWEMLDETYRMNGADDPSNHVILTTSHPKSLTTLAWTRKYRNAPVFCYASGHGTDTYANQNFRTVVERGIGWLADQRAK
jgi:type 1 glutamine amidotransferase